MRLEPRQAVGWHAIAVLNAASVPHSRKPAARAARSALFSAGGQIALNRFGKSPAGL